MDDRQENNQTSKEADDKPKFAGGIAPADFRMGRAARAEVATAEYHERVKETLGDRLYGTQYYDDHHSLHVRIKGGSLRDFGDRMVPKFGGTTDEVRAMVALAQMRGWEKITVSGGEHCRRSLWREAVAHGYAPDAIVGYEPNAADLALVPEADDDEGTAKAACAPSAPPQSRRPRRKM